jgi:hypothetical protein
MICFKEGRIGFPCARRARFFGAPFCVLFSETVANLPKK